MSPGANGTLYKEYLPLIDDFIYGHLPLELAIKVSDKQVENLRKPGKKFPQWILRGANSTYWLSHSNKFGLLTKTDNGTPFEIRTEEGNIVWIKKSETDLRQHDWIKITEGILGIREDRKGRPYTIIDGMFVGHKYLDSVSEGDSVKITAIRHEEDRWSVISLIKV